MEIVDAHAHTLEYVTICSGYILHNIITSMGYIHVEEEKITVNKAAEILGISVLEMRKQAKKWKHK
ncbi:MAG: hypothetical protein ACOCVD_03695 [Bacillota bacterium]